MTPAALVVLSVDVGAARRARSFVEQAHCAVHNADVLEDVRLLVSELVTNAVQHAVPPVTLEVDCAGRAGMNVRVGDGDPNPLPASGSRSRSPGPGALSGRGLAMVEVVSDDWGVEPAPQGKVVWFRLARGR